MEVQRIPDALFASAKQLIELNAALKNDNATKKAKTEERDEVHVTVLQQMIDHDISRFECSGVTFQTQLKERVVRPKQTDLTERIVRVLQTRGKLGDEEAHEVVRNIFEPISREHEHVLSVQNLRKRKKNGGGDDSECGGGG